MAKRKKRRRTGSLRKRPLPKLMRDLATAMVFFEAGDKSEARQALLQLVAKNPRSKPVLLALVEVCGGLEDWRTLAIYSERLLPMERGDERAETMHNLMVAHMKLVYPALTWHYAHELVGKHPDFEMLGQAHSMIEVTESMLLDEAATMLEMAGVTSATELTNIEKLNLMVQHDRVRFYTESGQPESAILTAEAFLKKLPNIIPILNNLSLAQFMVGDVEQAIVTANKVLMVDADNFHALSNLTRFAFLIGQFDQAKQHATRLLQISNDNSDLATKQAEALAFLGDDKGIQIVYEQAKSQHDELNPLLLHLAAVAHYRLGDEKMAWSLWHQAVRQAPSFEMAQNSLAERPLPVGERTIPWYWPFHYWFTNDFHQAMEKFGKGIEGKGSKKVKQVMKAMLGKRPYLSQLFPHMLERGDQATREFVLHAIRIAETPELLQMLYDFAQSRYSTDELRMEAIQFISQNHSQMLPESRQVSMWHNGQQTELFMMAFEITDEPDWVDTSDEVLDKHDAAYELILDDEIDAAERLLDEIIAADPNFYSAYNHLALVYEKQDRTEESRTLIEETHVRFPDYLFARVGLARILTQENRIDEAKALLNPILRQTKLHISEFRALARAEMDIALADDNSESARSWLEMWRQMEDDNLEILQWEMRIDGSNNLPQGLQTLLGQSRKISTQN